MTGQLNFYIIFIMKIKRIKRKELRKNELFEALEKIIFYVRVHPKNIKMGLALAGGLFFVFLIGNFLIKRAVNTPREELAQTIFSYHYAQGKDQFSASKALFDSFLSKHKRGQLSDIALLYKGASEKGLNEYATSSETFKGLIHKKNNIISSCSLMNLANIEEEKGNYKKAIEYYKIIKAKDDYLKEYAKERISKLNRELLLQIGTSSPLP